VSSTVLSKHIGGKLCQETVKFPNKKVGFCKYCNIDISNLNKSEKQNHVQWCSHNPNKTTKRKQVSEQLNASWKTNKDDRISKVKYTKSIRYGDENYNNPSKNKETNIINNGGYSNNREQAKETCINKYGVDNPNKLKCVRDKIENTNLEKYGVRHLMQDHNVFEERQSYRKTNKQFTFPSGKVVNVQGYEPLVIQQLLDSGYSEDQIQVTGRKGFKYVFEGKERIYHPDIIIPHENRVIEVKSKYWYERELSKNLAKQQGTISAGFTHEFVIVK
jgi:hypothetical protein